MAEAGRTQPAAYAARGGGLVIQCTVDVVVVVVESPAVDYPTGLFQAQEQFSVQELVT